MSYRDEIEQVPDARMNSGDVKYPYAPACEITDDGLYYLWMARQGGSALRHPKGIMNALTARDELALQIDYLTDGRADAKTISIQGVITITYTRHSPITLWATKATK